MSSSKLGRLLAVLALVAAALSITCGDGGDGGGDPDVDDDCVWDESEWDECDWQ